MEILHAVSDILHAAVAWTAGWAETPHATMALFAIAFAESSFFPVPPDALMIPLALGAPARALWFALVCTTGSVLGGVLGYWIGRRGGRPVLDRFFNEHKVRLVQDQYRKYDIWAVGLAGFTPIPYKLFSISAGVFGLDFKRFVVATVVGRGGRFFAVGLLIFLFGDAVGYWLERYFEVAAVLFAVLLIGGFWFVGYLGRRASRVPDAAASDG